MCIYYTYPDKLDWSWIEHVGDIVQYFILKDNWNQLKGFQELSIIHSYFWVKWKILLPNRKEQNIQTTANRQVKGWLVDFYEYITYSKYISPIKGDQDQNVFTQGKNLEIAWVIWCGPYHIFIFNWAKNTLVQIFWGGSRDAYTIIIQTN